MNLSEGLQLCAENTSPIRVNSSNEVYVKKVINYNTTMGWIIKCHNVLGYISWVCLNYAVIREEHFSEVFEKTDVEAALAAGIFHREEVLIEAVKDHLREEGIETR